MTKRTRRATAKKKTAGAPGATVREAMDRAGMRVVVGIPMERTFHYAAVYQFWHIAASGSWPLAPIIYGRTDANRNLIAAWFLRSEYTHLCMLDADHLHAANIVEALARPMTQDPNRLIVAGVNFRRTYAYEPCIYRADADGRLAPVTDWDRTGLNKVDGVGTGCIMIARSVFETIPRPWFEYTYAFAADDLYPAEDLDFCVKARNAGIDIYADGRITSPHLGELAIDEATWAQVQKSEQGE